MKVYHISENEVKEITRQINICKANAEMIFPLITENKPTETLNAIDAMNCVSFQTACVFCVTVKYLTKRKEKVKEPNCPNHFNPRNSACIICDCSIDCRYEK